MLAAGAQGAVNIRNGTMDGEGTDGSNGKGLLVTPAGWTPVNVRVGRGDRLSVEESDRPGAGQCLHVRTFGGDAGVYQSLIPLDRGRTYLISAWVKRRSGTLAIKAYPTAWGPGVMCRLDGASSGWTRLTVGLTPIDRGAHLYLVAAPQADFLIDDVQIRPAPLQVGKPERLPFGFGSHWQYRVALTPTADGELPPRAQVRALEVGAGAAPMVAPQQIGLTAGESATVLLNMPLDIEGSFYVEVTRPEGGEVLGGSPVVRRPGSPWLIRYPHKDSLYASMDYCWPLRIVLLHSKTDIIEQIDATCTITGPDVTAARSARSALKKDAFEVLIDGRGLPAGDYRLKLVVRHRDGRQVFGTERPLRVLAPSETEVVCAPNGDTLVNGSRFFPIGLYWVLADPAGWKQGPGRKIEALHDLRRSGFNVLHTYAFEHNDANDTDDNAEAYLDMARDLGFMVMMGLRRDWCRGTALNREAIRRRVVRLRGHPALLCWTLWDEPDSDIRNVTRVQAIYDLVNRTDPYHPAMPVFMNAGGRRFRDAADINLLDRYPGAGNAGVLPPMFERCRAAIPDKPIWYVAQAYEQRGKLPSEQDMRQYWKHALDADVKAVFWYSYGGDRRGWDSVRITPEHYANVKRAVRALADAVEAR